MKWVICAFLLLSFLNVQAEDYTTGYQVAHGVTKTIYVLEGTEPGTGKWYQIVNLDASINVFIPSLTATEWNAFLAHPPAYLTLSVSNPKSCNDIYTFQKIRTDGNRTIDPDGPGGNASFSAYCDMTQDSGGWTRLNSYSATSDVGFDGSENVIANNIGQGCGGTTKSINISAIGIAHTMTKYILTRSTTIAQCPNFGGSSSVGTYYFNGTSWVSGGTCGWSPPWATSGNNVSTTGLPLIWKFIENSSASALYFHSQCSASNDNGQVSIQYFVR